MTGLDESMQTRRASDCAKLVLIHETDVFLRTWGYFVGMWLLVNKVCSIVTHVCNCHNGTYSVCQYSLCCKVRVGMKTSVWFLCEGVGA